MGHPQDTYGRQVERGMEEKGGGGGGGGAIGMHPTPRNKGTVACGQI